MGHSGRPFLPFCEGLLHLTHLGSLIMPYFSSDFLHRRRYEGKTKKILRVNVSLYHLRRYSRGTEPQQFARITFHLRSDIGVGTDGTRHHSHAHALPRSTHPLKVPSHLVIPEGKHKTQRSGFGVYAVGAPDHSGVLVVKRLFAKNLEQLLKTPDYESSRLLKLYRKSGVKNIRRCHSEMNESRIVSYVLGNAGKKSQDVVLKLCFKLCNSFYVEGGFFLYVRKGFGRNFTVMRPRFAHGKFHLEPDAVAVLIRPYPRHFLSGIS